MVVDVEFSGTGEARRHCVGGRCLARGGVETRRVRSWRILIPDGQKRVRRGRPVGGHVHRQPDRVGRDRATTVGSMRVERSRLTRSERSATRLARVHQPARRDLHQRRIRITRCGVDAPGVDEHQRRRRRQHRPSGEPRPRTKTNRSSHHTPPGVNAPDPMPKHISAPVSHVPDSAEFRRSARPTRSPHPQIRRPHIRRYSCALSARTPTHSAICAGSRHVWRATVVVSGRTSLSRLVHCVR